MDVKGTRWNRTIITSLQSMHSTVELWYHKVSDGIEPSSLAQGANYHCYMILKQDATEFESVTV